MSMWKVKPTSRGVIGMPSEYYAVAAMLYAALCVLYLSLMLHR
jgi:hypothetical protein